MPVKALQWDMKDILKNRRDESDAKWAARSWNPVVAWQQPRHVNAQFIKTLVLRSSRLRHLVNQISDEEGTTTEELYQRVRDLLEEIGYNKEMPVLRWLGLFTSKVLKRLCSAIYVNESALLKVKESMGRNPVIFVPTHRSYGDFILMSYVCFHYELDIPRIAAGMDFHGMILMGEILRDSCAFFMRRSFAQDKLYSATFSEYVQALITHGDGALEFFIEGTRSRSAKSLMPKFGKELGFYVGFLTMALRPYLTGLVPNISIVPVSICYDRCLEESLFAYELLGVPKPKESTKGFLKALKILKEDYGKVYITFGSPISVAEAMQDSVDRSVHSFGPVVLQDLTSTESHQVVRLAHNIISRQRELTTLTCFNVIAAVMNWKLMQCKPRISLSELIEEVRWLTNLLLSLGASIDVNVDCLESCVQDSIRLHRDLISEKNGQVCIRRNHLYVPRNSSGAQSGCQLTASTMHIAVPLLTLQHYVNPCCQYLVHLAFIAIALASAKGNRLPIHLLKEKIRIMRQLFAQEFVLYCDSLEKDMEEALSRAQDISLISIENDGVFMEPLVPATHFFIAFLAPFFSAYLLVTQFLHSMKDQSIGERDLLRKSQLLVQLKIAEGCSHHPANLSLETCNNAIQALCSMGILSKTKGNGHVILSINQSPLQDLRHELATWNCSISTDWLSALQFVSKL